MTSKVSFTLGWFAFKLIRIRICQVKHLWDASRCSVISHAVQLWDTVIQVKILTWQLHLLMCITDEIIFNISTEIISLTPHYSVQQLPFALLLLAAADVSMGDQQLLGVAQYISHMSCQSVGVSHTHSTDRFLNNCIRNEVDPAKSIISYHPRMLLF